ncbi:MAG: hypothetical protein K9M80_01860 [Candidatus Marinimicrobia bacterium]|nr:hypothetical protein [Candidatus Neomarinimicrobiota bacterium]
MFYKSGITTEAHKSISSKMLMEAGIANPDKIPTIMRLFPDEAPLISILDIKGQKTNNLNYATNDSNYRTVGSNHIQYPVQLDKERMDSFKSGPDGKTFVCDAYPTTPGYQNTEIGFYADGNWAGFQEVVELPDNRSYLYILDDPEPVDESTFFYRSKIVGYQPGDYIDPVVFTEGQEFKAVYNLHEQDFSERSTEKYRFDGWNDAYLSLQRFSYSWSGTAKASTTMSGRWVEHNGKEAFFPYAHEEMMRRAAIYWNNQLVWGKSTVSTQDKSKVTLFNKLNREVLAGDGVMYANDGYIDMPLNGGWNTAFIDAFLMALDPYISADIDGTREVVLLMTSKAYFAFERFMGSIGKTNDNNIVGEGENKGINDTYKYYEFAGIRLVPKRWKSLDPHNRPGMLRKDGTKSNEWDVIAIPTGMVGNKNGIELVQLRPSSQGTVAGIDKGGNISNSVDGSSSHLLFQNGVISHKTTFLIHKI